MLGSLWPDFAQVRLPRLEWRLLVQPWNGSLWEGNKAGQEGARPDGGVVRALADGRCRPVPVTKKRFANVPSQGGQETFVDNASSFPGPVLIGSPSRCLVAADRKVLPHGLHQDLVDSLTPFPEEVSGRVSI